MTFCRIQTVSNSLRVDSSGAQLSANEGAMKRAVDTAIDVDGVGWHVKGRNRVVVLGFQAIKHFPIIGGDTIASFAS